MVDFFSIPELLSRYEFLNLLEKYIIQAKKENKNVALILLDIDDFLELELIYGFEIRNHLLYDFGIYLKQNLQLPKVFLSYGEKDQFLIGLYDFSLSELIEFLENLKNIIKDYKFNWKKEVITFTASFGVSTYPHDGKNSAELLGACETALALAKKEGKNTWRGFRKEIREEFLKIASIRKILEKAILENRVVPFIQPIVDAENKSIIGGEILLRIIENTNEIVEAQHFIKIANEKDKKGYIEEFENILFEKITQENFLKVFKNKYMFVNKTLKGLDKIKYLIEETKVLKSLVEEYQIKPVFEITEFSFMEHVEILPLLIQEIKEKKVYLAIDDFGVGYASLSYLLNIDADFLKIDGSIVKKILSSKRHMSVIKTIIYIAKELNIKTVAEHIEDKNIADILYILGVDYLQGFYFGKPMPIEEFKKFS